METKNQQQQPRAEYKPDLAMRIAMARAAKEQPPLLSLASKVPSYRGDGG